MKAKILHEFNAVQFKTFLVPASRPVATPLVSAYNEPDRSGDTKVNKIQ